MLELTRLDDVVLPSGRRDMEHPPTKKTELWPSKGFVTLKQILGRYGGPIPIGPTRWWEGVKTGEFPQPLKFGGRTVWRVEDINALIENPGEAKPTVSQRRRTQSRAVRP